MSGKGPSANLKASAEDDKLSDYVPESGDLSRAPTAPVSRVASKAPSGGEDEDVEMQDADQIDEEEDDDDDEEETTSTSKTPRQLEKEKEKESQKAQRTEVRQATKAKLAARNQDLNTKRSAVNRSKGADSLKRFSYLLGQTELFQHFVDLRKDRDPEFAKLLEESEAAKVKKGKRKSEAGGNRRRKTEKEEDEELLRETEEDESFVFEESPPYVTGGTMRDYQVQGLNWMM